MTGSGRSIEDRLSAALTAEGEQTLPSDSSLDTIRTRVGAVRRRRRVVLAAGTTLAVVAVAIAVPVLVGDPDRVTTDTTPATSPTSSPPEPGTTGPGPTTSVPGAGDDAALRDAVLWPSPDGPGVTSAREAAVSFLTDVVGVTDPALSSFQSERPDVGTFDLYERSESGEPRTGSVASTLEVRQFDDSRWFVTAASSSDVVISSPTWLTAVSSPLAVAGEGHGFEGTLVVSLLARSSADSGDPLGSVTVQGGSGEALEPFSGSLVFDPPASPDTGILLASDTSGLENAVPRFSALAVRLDASDAPTPTVPGWSFRNQPLFPFATAEEAEAWRVDPSHQPWHADPEATALAFVDYLGFAEISTVTSRDVRDRDAWIGVGYPLPESDRTSTAAVLHLQRFGPALDSPWEVVGTRDTDLTLETPRYGAAAGPSPMTVGGHVTGVDESLRIEVRQLAAPNPIGVSCCLPAGGQDSAWQTTVDYQPVADQPLLVVVSTGGHLLGVERFAVTGLRPT